MKFQLLNSSKEVSEKLNTIMFRKKIKIKDLEKQMGLSYPTIHNKVNNAGNFKYSELIKLIGILKIDVKELLIKK